MAVDTPRVERLSSGGAGTTTDESEHKGRLIDGTTATFPPTPDSVGAARSFVADLVPEELRDRAVLVISELATNAVLYAGTRPFEVRVRLAPTRRIEIRDASTVLPTMSDLPTDATHGRGLRIVDAFTAAWGVCLADNGKLVWCEF